MKTFTIDLLDLSSVEDITKEIDAMIKRLEDPKELFNRLLQPAADIASRKFMSAIDGNPDVQDAVFDVGVTINGNTATLWAAGDQVGFIEFGTGVGNPDWKGDPRLPFYPPFHGSYGLGRGNNPLGWQYTNDSGETVWTTGLVPAEAMLDAWRYVVSNAIKTAREIYGND